MSRICNITYLFIDPLPTIPALDRALDDGITAEILIQTSEAVQRHAQANKVDGFVQKDAVYQNQSPVQSKLLLLSLSKQGVR